MEKENISNRIQDLIQVIQVVASGDFSARTIVSSQNDQIDALAVGINMMTEELSGRFDELRKTREEIKESLKEKEALLKEVHHRVKNNLQIISSLLSLQSGYIKDARALEVFRKSQDRLKLIALVHEKLYKSQDLTRIDFAEYVRNLLAQIFRSYGISPEIITPKLNIKNVSLEMDTAVSCGLLINELISNSLKYAFPAGRKGEICIEFFLDSKNKYNLIVSDNGVGLPKDLDYRNTKTLGFQLVNTTARQLEGKIGLDRSQGTKFKITFYKKKEKDEQRN